MLRLFMVSMLAGLLATAGYSATVRVTKEQSGRTVALATGDTLEVALYTSNPPGVYRWQMTSGNTALLKSLGAPTFELPSGTAGLQVFRFQAIAPGTANLAFAYRPRNRTSPTTAHFTLRAKITGTPMDRRITLQAGQIGVAQGKVPLNTTDHWVVSLKAGQTLRVALAPLFEGGDAILIIFGKDGNVLISDHAGAKYFEGTVPTTQDYNIDIRPMANTSPEYRMLVTTTP